MKYLLYVFVSMSFLTVSGQTRKIDLLRESISKARSKQEKADLHDQLAEALYSFNFDKGLEQAKISLQIATEIDYKRGIAQAHTSIGNYYYYKGENAKAYDSYRQALVVAQNSKITDYPIRTYFRLSIMFRQQAYFDSSQIYLDKAEAILQHQDDVSLRAAFFASSGILSNAMSQNDRALVFLRKSIHIRKSLPDTVRLADSWRCMGEVYSDISMYDSAAYCYQRALTLIGKINEPEIHMLLSLSQGETNFYRGNFNEAITNYQDAIDRMKVNTYKRYYAYLLYKIGELYENQGVYNVAFDYLFKALKEFEAINARQDMARTYSQIGWCYNYQQIYAQAIENGNKAMTIATLIGDSSGMAQNQNLIGYALLKQGKHQQALVFFSESLALRKRLKNLWGVSYTLHNMALANIEIGKSKQAFDLLHESLEINKRIGNKGGIVFTCNELGALYAKNRQFDKAEYYLIQARNLAQKIPLPTQLISTYKNFIILYKEKNDTQKTIRYYELHTELKDSLSNQINSGRISEADALFQLQKKANEIELIHKENELKEAKISSQQTEINFQRYIIIVITIGLIILVVLIALIYRLLKSRTRDKDSLRKQNKEILEQQEEIQTQSEELAESNTKLIVLNDNLIEKNHEIELQSEKIQQANQNLEKRVEERTNQLNVAYQELETFFYRTSHDFRRPLTTYLGLVEIAKATLGDKQALDLFEKVKETTIGLDSMLIKLQSISNIDFENQSNEFSLNTVINQCIEKHKTKIQSRNIEVIVHGDDKTVRTNEHLFRTFLENILENAIQYSSPVKPYIKINATVTDSNLVLIVEDNGQGIAATIQHKIFEMYFRGNDNSKGNGLGLYVAKRAVDKLRGTITFISRLHEGSSFKIVIPIRY